MDKNTLSLRDKGSMPTSSRPKFRETKNPYLMWEAPEYEYRPKTKDWYWIVWIVGLAGAVWSYFTGNTLFGLLLVLITIAVTILGLRIPEMIQVKMNEKGIMVKDKVYPFSKIESFNINENDYKLILKRNSDVLPVLVVPLNPNIKIESLVSFLENFVEFDEELDEHLFEIISEKLGI